MIADLKQPAKNWLADVMRNFGVHLKEGDDPSMEIVVGGVVMQIRLMEIPGNYKREEIEINIGGNPEAK